MNPVVWSLMSATPKRHSWEQNSRADNPDVEEALQSADTAGEVTLRGGRPSSLCSRGEEGGA